MNKTIALLFATGLLVGSSAANAKPMHHHAKAPPSTVTIDGKDYPVCAATVTDSCINPRQAGLKWGNTPLNKWPGHPASDDKPGH